MMALDPYAPLIKGFFAGSLLAAAFLGGCHVQAKHDAGKVAKAQAALRDSAAALGDARDALRRFADTFDDISAQTRAAADAAAKQIEKGQASAKQAQAEHAAAEQRVDALERQLRAERAGCVDAGRSVCGIPLQ